MKAMLFAGALLAPFAVFADTPAQQFEPVVVTATRSPQPQNALPAALTIITRQDIATSGAQNLADALRGVAGIQVTDFFGDGSQYTSIDMRGFGSAANANTLILVDGRRLNNPDIASPDLSSIALKDVERIEVILGSAGTLYGDQAVGGVINIITRQPSALAADASLGIGSYRGREVRAAVGQRVGGYFYRLSGESRGSDNYRSRNHHEYENVLGRAGYDYGSGSAYLEAGYVNDRIELPGALTAAEVAQDPRQCEPLQCGNYNDSGTALQRINWEQALGEHWNLESDLTHRRSDSSVQLTSFGTRQHLTQARNVWALNPRLSGKFALPAGTALFTAGIDAQLAEYELVSVFGPQRDTQRQRDVYAQAVLPLLSSLEATVGARAARVDNNLYDGVTFASSTPVHDSASAWEGGLAWKPLQNLRGYARYDRNFRFAKADEFFSFSNLFPTPTPAQVSLATQTGGTYEVGADWKPGAFDLHASVYQLELKNEISFNPFTFTNFNLDHTRRRGAIVQAQWQMLEHLRLSAGGQYLKAQFTGGPSAGKDVPLAARRTGRLAATLQLPRAIDTSVEVLATSHRGFDGDLANAMGQLPGFAVTNLAINGHSGGWHAGARINNVFGQRYSEYGALDFTGTPNFYPSPQRNFWLTLGYSI